MGAEPWRCSATSAALREPLTGTASTVATWIMLEQPGPWGGSALLTSRLPEGVGLRLRSLSVSLGVRIVLIRRHGRHTPDGTVTCFVGHAGPGRTWLERARLSGPRDLLDADLSPLREGHPPGLGEADPDPLFLTCTHGARDPCCAERGRPVALALDRRFGDRAWEVSHIGGDRFAGNVVCFPHGLYFGRVDRHSAVQVAEAYARGVIDLDHYRGRCCYPFAVQSAETFVRLQSGLVGVEDLTLKEMRRRGSDEVDAIFAGRDGQIHRVRVRTHPAEVPRVLTCHGIVPAHPPVHELVRPE